MSRKSIFTIFLILMGSLPMLPQGSTEDGTIEFENSKNYIQKHPETRLSLLKSAIEKGNSDAMVAMGTIYYNGYANIKKGNYTEAFKYWSKAIEKNNANGFFNIGLLYLYGNGVDKNIEIAINYWKQSADMNNTHAMTELGHLYFNKKIIPRDVENALVWYKKAVDHGVTKLIPVMLTTEVMVESEKTLKNPNATDFEKGKAYFELENGKEALIWLEKAAKKKNDKAMTAMGMALEKWGQNFNRYKDAASWYKKAASSGNEKAMYLLGKLYEQGRLSNNGMIDYTDAMKWYEKAAKKNDIDALLAMGWLYYTGKHDEKPSAIYNRKGPLKYAAWNSFMKVAEQGHPDGYYYLGLMLEQGFIGEIKGEKYGYADAKEWYQKAADLGVEKAQNALHKFNTGFEYQMGLKHFNAKEYTEAKKMFEQADKKSKHLQAIKYLGEMYEKGLGVEKNVKTALEYYSRAAISGDIRAKGKVSELYDNDPKYQNMVTQYRKEVAEKGDESLKKVLAEYDKKKKEEDEYNEMLYQQSLNRGQITIGSSWEGFSYDNATRSSFKQIDAANKARTETANYKRYLEYKFGK